MTHVVVGVGNAYRRDDGAGLAVAARLRGRVPAGVDVVQCEQELSRLIDAWHGAAAAVVVDAVASGAEPGTLHRFDAGQGAIPARVFRSSTHAFGVGEAIELARVLGKLPGRVVVYGIEGHEFVAGEGLTAAVEAAVETAARAVLEDLDRLARGTVADGAAGYVGSAPLVGGPERRTATATRGPRGAAPGQGRLV